jgi:hypothetical protein
MTTSAAYLPVVGNFNPADGFSFKNSVGDEVLPVSAAPFGQGRPGKFKFGFVLIINGGPVGDDSSFKVRIPYPIELKQSILDVNTNFYFPTGSLLPSLPGSTAMDMVFAAVFDVAAQVMELTLSFGNPQPLTFASGVYLDFGHTINN